MAGGIARGLVCRVAGAALLAVAAVQGQHIQPNDTIPEYLAKYGIQVQEHTVHTDDGYIISVFRLPRPGAPVAMLQHGAWCSAWFWLDNTPELAPGIQVYNMGYDVWLTNNRGTIFGTKHEKLSPTLDKKFWDFSWADMGRHDVPSHINYILNQTGQDTLTYVGHSQGTSQFFVAMTSQETRALMEAKVNLFVAISPVTYMQHQRSLLLKVVTDFKLGALTEEIWPFGILDMPSYKYFADWLCSLTNGTFCRIGVDSVCGTSKLDNMEAIQNVSAHFPGGTSSKCLNHYSQLMLGTEFRDYDYGGLKNLIKYGQITPPRYDLSTAKVPTAMFIGALDDVGDVRDSLRAASELPSSVLVFNETFADFSHVTFFSGYAAAFPAWFPKLQALLRKYNPLQAEGALSQVLVV